jgi:uncharacterized membrane protein YbaN (DUF454 family)
LINWCPCVIWSSTMWGQSNSCFHKWLCMDPQLNDMTRNWWMLYIWLWFRI